MAKLQYTFSELYAAVGREWLNDAAPTGADLARCKAIVNEAYQEFVSERNWSWLNPEREIELWTTTTTPAITVGGAGNTTCTAASAVFHKSMVGHAMVADTSGTSYTITAYTSATVVTVSADASADDGDTFTITADGHYTLPSDYEGGIEHLSFLDEVNRREVVKRSPAFVRTLLGNEDDPYADPQYFAVQMMGEHSASIGAMHEIIVWPIPATDRTVATRMSIVPNELSGDSDLPICGPKHQTALYYLCLHKAEKEKGLAAGGPWYASYYGDGNRNPGALARSVQADLDESRGSVLGLIENPEESVPFQHPYRISEYRYSSD